MDWIDPEKPFGSGIRRGFSRVGSGMAAEFSTLLTLADIA
jgi:hypothetical protein